MNNLREIYTQQHQAGLLPATPIVRDFVAAITVDPIVTMRFVLPTNAQWLVTEWDEKEFFWGYCYRRYAGGLIESRDYFSLRNLERETRLLQLVQHKPGGRTTTTAFNGYVKMDTAFKPTALSQLKKGNFKL